MFANLCFQILEYFNITSSHTLKIVFSIFLALLVFGVFYMIIKFTGLEVDNLNKNILTLIGVDILSFGYLMYKRKQTQETKVSQNEVQETNEAKEEFKEEIKKDLEEIKENVDDEIVEKVKEVLEEEKPTEEAQSNNSS